MIKIVRLEEKHVDEIVAIEEHSFSIPWSKTAFLGELLNQNAHYFVAMIDEKVVGYGGFWYIVNEGHITNIAVHEDYRGQGIGSLILDEMIAQKEELWMIGLTLEVRVSNVNAIKFYEKKGFVEEGVRKNYYENNEDALIMWLNY